MSSPEAPNPDPNSSPVQDSPFLRYVSSFSPIKSDNIRPGVQAYDNIDVPSPQHVFKTPIFSRPRNSSLLERSQHASFSGAETFSPRHADNAMEFSESVDINRHSISLSMIQSISCTEKEYNSGDPSPNESFISPSSCVDAFLADPSENSDSLSGSPDFCVKRPTNDARGDTGYAASQYESQSKYCKEDLAHDHPCTTAVPVNELMDDCMEHSTSSVLHGLSSGQASDVPQTLHNNYISTKETIKGLHPSDAEKYIRHNAVLRSGASYQAEEDHGNVHVSNYSVEINERSIDRQLSSIPKDASTNTAPFIVQSSSTRPEHISVNQFAIDHHILSKDEEHHIQSKDVDFCIIGRDKESSTTLGFAFHGPEYVNIQTARNGQSGELDCTPQLHPGSPPNIQAGDIHLDESRRNISTENQISFDQEEGAQYQRGKRKRLQFEAVDNLMGGIGCSKSSCNNTIEGSDVDLVNSSLDLGTRGESVKTSSNKQVIESVPGNALGKFPAKVDGAAQCKGSSPVIDPRPSGIGLHLNSIGITVPNNCNPEEHSVSEGNYQVVQELKDCSSSRSLIEYSVIVGSENSSSYMDIENEREKHEENQAINVPMSSVHCQPPMLVKPLNISLPSKLIDRDMAPCIMNRPPSEEASRSEESIQTSPRKRRKKAPENEGYKRCNCKRSKCLKLYCDCFAAGAFCSEACACRECCNKADYEDTVREAKQQIESRNPLAFAPKVVLRVTDPSKDSGDSKHITPTSARHKRGCNCKKSLCLKKYCECYQAGVGCSMGCRCEGCKNTFGRKDGYGETQEILVHKRPKEGGWKRDLSGELEGIQVKNDELANSNKCQSRFSPITPLVEASTADDVPKAQFPAGCYPLPESGASVLPSYDESPSSAMDGINNSAFGREREGSSLVLYDPVSNHHNARKIDPFSPGWSEFQDICKVTPLVKVPPSPGGCPSASKTREPKTLHTKLFQGSGRISLNSLQWRSTPVTPMLQFGESKSIREPDSDSGVHCNLEDDTPEILKDSRSPIQPVKATSPNQKRVSPPHHETRSHSPGLKSGRRFILQSLTRFPSLSPYRDTSKGDDDK